MRRERNARFATFNIRWGSGIQGTPGRASNDDNEDDDEDDGGGSTPEVLPVGISLLAYRKKI